MSARQFSLHRAERRATQVVLIAGIWLVRAAVLSHYRAGDVRRRLTRRAP